MKRTRALAATVAVLLALVTVAGCGSDVSNLPVKQLLAKARTQLKTSHYLTIKGKVTEGKTSVGINLHYVGKDSSGTLDVSGKPIHIETVKGKTYFKPSQAFWKAELGSGASRVQQLIKGRWIPAPKNNPQFVSLTQFGNREALAKQMLEPSTKKISKGKTKTVNGVDSVALDSTNGTLYLDTSDASPVQIVGNGTKGTGTVDFSYDQTPAPKAPKKKDIFDLSKLGG